MRNPHWPNNIGAEVARKRAQSLAQETQDALARADLGELEAVREALLSLKDRLARMITRHHVTPIINLLDRAAFDVMLQRNRVKENKG